MRVAFHTHTVTVNIFTVRGEGVYVYYEDGGVTNVTSQRVTLERANQECWSEATNRVESSQPITLERVNQSHRNESTGSR